MPIVIPGSEHANALPWLLPGVAVSVVIAAIGATRVGRTLGIGALHAGALVASLGVILAVTITPVWGAFEGDPAGFGECDLSRIALAPIAQLVSVNETSLNVLLFVPLGAAIGLLPRSRSKAAMIAVAIALPFAIEAIQSVATALERGCQSADVIDNLAGLVLGLAIGVAARWVLAPSDSDTELDHQ